MQHILLKKAEDKQTLVGDLFDHFKEHLRILHNHEDDSISLYLIAAIDDIATYSDNYIFATEYEVFYPQKLDYRTPSNLYGWYAGKSIIRDVAIFDGNGVDVTGDFTIDNEHGMIYPHPFADKITLKTGYDVADDMPARLVNIIFRLGASYHEMREHEKIGETKALPDWLNYSLASLWSARI